MSVMKTGIGRRVAAFFITPLLAPALMFLVSIGKPAEGVWVALFAMPFTIGTAVFPGIPLYFLSRKFGWTSKWAYMLIGVLCGLLASLLLFTSTAIRALTTHESDPWTSMVAFSLIFCFLGSFSGLMFWLIARPDRPFSTSEA